MSERSRLRLIVLQVLVMSLLLTLLGRLWFVQVVQEDQFEQASTANRVRPVVTPAPRGQILDVRGRALATNVTALVVSVSRTELLRQDDGGKALLTRVAEVVGTTYDDVWGRTRLCGEKGAPKPPVCWNGEPLAPIPVTENASEQMALQIEERAEDFPGVTAERTTIRTYPSPEGIEAPHELGYIGPVDQGELDAQEAAGEAPLLAAGDEVGRSGLEKQYDADLRGTPGVRELSVDRDSAVTGTVTETAPQPGRTLVTHLDAKVQAVAERELLAAIKRARATADVNVSGRNYKGDSGAVVVLDTTNGGIVAMASYPSYDPNVWVGGISEKDYAAISSEKNNYPNQSRAFQGEFAPASTFKVVTLPGALQGSNLPLGGTFDCPSAYKIGNSFKQNYESRGYGAISLTKAIQVSCDTVFYDFAVDQWYADGGNSPRKDPRDPMFTVARGFGLGERTGLDLPGERAGRIPDRAWKKDYWEATKDTSCVFARTGYPGVAKEDPARARFLKQLASENCSEGFKYRAGDAANFSIGQGDTLTTPLQMASVYAAIGNGGTLWEPHVGKAVVEADGTLVREIGKKKVGTIPVEPRVLDFLQKALPAVTTGGTGRAPFATFPLDRIPIATKTGTGEVYGKQTTSWFASYAPADKPRYAVVMMVSQGGTGSATSGPGVAAIYRALFGVDAAGRIDPAKAAMPGGVPPTTLPRITADGTVVAPRTTYARKDSAAARARDAG